MKEEIHGGFIKDLKYDFSVNVNPLGCPMEIKSEIREAVDEIEKYPEYGAGSLREKLGLKLNIDPERILMTNGASEAFMLLSRLKDFKEGIIIPPCFSGYHYALKGAGIKERKLNEEGLLDEKDFDGRIVFLANPNNPDGRIYDPEFLKGLISHITENGGTAVLDECFLTLSGHNKESLMSFGIPGLYVVRSFTKTFSMPSVRLGYIIFNGKQDFERLSSLCPEWNISGPGIRGGLRALDGDLEDWLQKSIALIGNERKYLEDGLLKMGLKYTESSVNFILFKGPLKIQERLLKEGILIRDCANFPGLGEGFFRISVKKHRENEILLDALERNIHD